MLYSKLTLLLLPTLCFSLDVYSLYQRVQNIRSNFDNSGFKIDPIEIKTTVTQDCDQSANPQRNNNPNIESTVMPEDPEPEVSQTENSEITPESITDSNASPNSTDLESDQSESTTPEMSTNPTESNSTDNIEARNQDEVDLTLTTDPGDSMPTETPLNTTDNEEPEATGMSTNDTNSTDVSTSQDQFTPTDNSSLPNQPEETTEASDPTTELDTDLNTNLDSSTAADDNNPESAPINPSGTTEAPDAVKENEVTTTTPEAIVDDQSASDTNASMSEDEPDAFKDHQESFDTTDPATDPKESLMNDTNYDASTPSSDLPLDPEPDSNPTINNNTSASSQVDQDENLKTGHTSDGDQAVKADNTAQSMVDYDYSSQINESSTNKNSDLSSTETPVRRRRALLSYEPLPVYNVRERRSPIVGDLLGSVTGVLPSRSGSTQASSQVDIKMEQPEPLVIKSVDEIPEEYRRGLYNRRVRRNANQKKVRKLGNPLYRMYLERLNNPIKPNQPDQKAS